MAPMDREIADEIKRHFEVVAESVRDDVQAVAEGVGSLGERIGSLETRVDALGQEVRHDFTETQAMIRLSYPSSIAGCGISRPTSDTRSRARR